MACCATNSFYLFAFNGTSSETCICNLIDFYSSSFIFKYDFKILCIISFPYIKAKSFIPSSLVHLWKILNGQIKINKSIIIHLFVLNNVHIEIKTTENKGKKCIDIQKEQHRPVNTNHTVISTWGTFSFSFFKRKYKRQALCPITVVGEEPVCHWFN